jgi:flap endonuclease-1
MGVRYLNGIIKSKCARAISHQSLRDYSGKTIAIDTSIYIHKYLGDNALMESMYFMMAQFRYFSITPIFIFDGVPPTEKHDVMQSRERFRQIAVTRYQEASEEMHHHVKCMKMQAESEPANDDESTSNSNSNSNINININININKITVLERKLRTLKKRFVRANACEISDLKRLMRSFNMRYIESEGESDLLCAHIVKCGLAFACMSDDMDMFLYGCPRVLRHVNLWHGTCVEYRLELILQELGVTLDGFRMICVLSGTDYSCSETDAVANTNADGELVIRHHKHNHNRERSWRDRLYLSDIIECYHDFIHGDDREDCDGNHDIDFYTWMKQHMMMKHVDDVEKCIDVESLRRVQKMFSANIAESQTFSLDSVLQIQKPNPPTDDGLVPARVKKLMARYNFIYV